MACHAGGCAGWIFAAANDETGYVKVGWTCASTVERHLVGLTPWDSRRVWRVVYRFATADAADVAERVKKAIFGRLVASGGWDSEMYDVDCEGARTFLEHVCQFVELRGAEGFLLFNFKRFHVPAGLVDLLGYAVQADGGSVCP
eukprot:1766086-Rhodomonas_salina.1